MAISLRLQNRGQKLKFSIDKSKIYKTNKTQTKKELWSNEDRASSTTRVRTENHTQIQTTWMSRVWQAIISHPDISSMKSHRLISWWSKMIVSTLSQNIHKEFQRRLDFKKMMKKMIHWTHRNSKEAYQIILWSYEIELWG